MSCEKYIVDSNTCHHGEGKCSKCKNIIKGIYLVKNIYDMKSRGNENDITEIYCHNCSSGDKTWINYFRNEIRERDKIIKEYQDKIEKILNLIQE